MALATLTQSPTQATTNTPNYLPYNPTAGTQDFNDTWGNNYTYRDPTTPYERNLDTKVSTYAAGKDPRVSIYNLMKQYPNNNPGFNYTQEIQKLDQEMQGYKDIISRRDNNAIYKALATDPNYSYLKNKGLTQTQAAETIAGKLAGYGISNLNEIGTTPDGKFYSKLTGKEIPKQFGYTTWGDGMQKFYLQATPDGRVVPTSGWKETGMSTGGILGTLAAVGAGIAAPWAVPALGGALGVGGVAAGGLYGAGAGALSSGLSGGNVLNGALTGGLTGAVGGGLLDYFSGVANLPDVSSLNSGFDLSNIDNLIQGGSITSGQGASALVNAAPVGTNIAGVAGGALNPALSAGAGALSNLATSDLASLANNFQSPASISTVGESTGLNNTGTGLSDVPTGQITNLGTDMITSPENLQSLVNSSPIGSELLPGTPGTTGGYLNPTMAAGSGVAAAAQGTGPTAHET